MTRDEWFDEAVKEHADTVLERCGGDVDRARAALVATFRSLVADVDLIVAESASMRAAAADAE